MADSTDRVSELEAENELLRKWLAEVEESTARAMAGFAAGLDAYRVALLAQKSPMDLSSVTKKPVGPS